MIIKWVKKLISYFWPSSKDVVHKGKMVKLKDVPVNNQHRVIIGRRRALPGSRNRIRREKLVKLEKEFYKDFHETVKKNVQVTRGFNNKEKKLCNDLKSIGPGSNPLNTRKEFVRLLCEREIELEKFQKKYEKFWGDLIEIMKIIKNEENNGTEMGAIREKIGVYSEQLKHYEEQLNNDLKRIGVNKSRMKRDKLRFLIPEELEKASEASGSTGTEQSWWFLRLANLARLR